METLDDEIYQSEKKGYTIRPGKANLLYLALSVGIVYSLSQSFAPALDSVFNLNRGAKSFLFIPVLVSAVMVSWELVRYFRFYHMKWAGDLTLALLVFEALNYLDEILALPMEIEGVSWIKTGIGFILLILTFFWVIFVLRKSNWKGQLRAYSWLRSYAWINIANMVISVLGVALLYYFYLVIDSSGEGYLETLPLLSLLAVPPYVLLIFFFKELKSPEE
ncbi:hypothetical protein KFE98_19835 [bacterium SCSIO 12741]|nr:hypothetical protein KFE98_19835 [bacterium SCSIO 12741]